MADKKAARRAKKKLARSIVDDHDDDNDDDILNDSALHVGPGLDTVVRTPAQFKAAMRKGCSGCVIVLADGEWANFRAVVLGEGTSGAPLVVRAQTPGKVFLTGRSSLSIGGAHLVLQGLVFRDCEAPSGMLVQFRVGKGDTATLASHCRLTDVVVDRCNASALPPDASEHWVVMHGLHNRIDHCSFLRKENRGVTVWVDLKQAEKCGGAHHSIDHNYFGPRSGPEPNWGESVRVGTGAFSNLDVFCNVHHNLFEECDSEVETISIKSQRNTVAENVFLRCKGTVTLRRGSGNMVERNFFLAEGKVGCGGVRLIDTDHVVRHNVFVAVPGTQHRSALCLAMGDTPDRTTKPNGYVRVRRGLIERNTFVSCSRLDFAGTNSKDCPQPPQACVFRHNVLVDCPADAMAGAAGGEVTGTGNVWWPSVPLETETSLGFVAGLATTRVGVFAGRLGLGVVQGDPAADDARSKDSDAADAVSFKVNAGADAGLMPLARAEVGPCFSWP